MAITQKSKQSINIESNEAAEEWQRLSEYLCQFEPEIDYLEDVLTWKNPRHSIAMLLLINGAFLWYTKTTGQRVFIVSLATISLAFYLPQVEDAISKRTSQDWKKFYHEVLSRLERQQRFFNLDEISQIFVSLKATIDRFLTRRKKQPVQFWTITIFVVCTTYINLYYLLTRRLMFCYFVVSVTFFTPYILHHRVLQRLADYVRRNAEEHDKTNVSKVNQVSSSFTLDPTMLDKETQDQIMASSSVSISDFVFSKIESINKESEEQGNSRLEDSPLISQLSTQSGTFKVGDADSLLEFYPSAIGSTYSETVLSHEDTGQLISKALDPETDSLLEFYPSDIDQVDKGHEHKSVTNVKITEKISNEVLSSSGAVNSSASSLTSDSSDYILIEQPGSQTPSNNEQSAVTALSLELGKSLSEKIANDQGRDPLRSINASAVDNGMGTVPWIDDDTQDKDANTNTPDSGSEGFEFVEHSDIAKEE